MPLYGMVRRGRLSLGLGSILLSWAICAAWTPPSAFGAETGRVALQVDKVTIPHGGTITGSVTGDWHAHKLRLVWVDERGRVTQHTRPRSNSKRGEPLRFSLSAAGAHGNSHRLVLLAEQHGGDKKAPPQWLVLAKASFRSLPKQQLAIMPVFGVDMSADLPQNITAGPVLDIARLSETPFLPPSKPVMIRIPFPLRSPLNLRTDKEWKQEAWRFMTDRRPGVRAPDLFDETAWSKLRKNMSAAVRQARPFSPSGYLLGTQPSLAVGRQPFEYGPDAFTLELFRAWLRKRYNGLAHLNTQWGTTFERWDDVAPLSTDDVKAANDPRYHAWLDRVRKNDPEGTLPKREGHFFFPANLKTLPPPGDENFSSWCDFHAFLDFCFARLLDETRTAMRSADPEAQIGFSEPLAPSPWGGLDIAALAGVTDWVAMPPDPVLSTMFQSFNPNAVQLAMLPARGDPAGALWTRWMQNASGVFLTSDANGKTAQETPVIPQETLTEFTRLSAFRKGFSPVVDPVALYYSPRSVALHWMLDSQLNGSDWPRRGTDGRNTDSPWLNWSAWVHLLQDLGISPRFISPAQLLSGQVGAKVLILPKVLSLGDEEAKAIRAFTLGGGVVIADSQCGLFDEHGRRRSLPTGGGAVGILDRDFGIRRISLWAHELNGAFNGDAAKARVTMIDPAKRGAMGPSSAELLVNEPGLRATAAWQFGRSTGGAAAVLTRNSGTGRAIYLNLAIQQYPQLRQRERTDFGFAGLNLRQYIHLYGQPSGGEALRVLVGDILSEIIEDPVVTVRNANGRPLRGVSISRWTSVDTVLIGLRPPDKGWYSTDAGDTAHPRNPPSEKDPSAQEAPAIHHIQMLYQHPLHWYDLRNQAYLGKGVGCPIKVHKSEPILLAGLPNRLYGIKVKTRRMDKAGLFSVALRFEMDQATRKSHVGERTLSVEVLNPAGEVLPSYREQITVAKGSWQGMVTIGFNDPPGLYKWRARDEVTGVECEAHLVKEQSLYTDLFPPKRNQLGRKNRTVEEQK